MKSSLLGLALVWVLASVAQAGAGPHIDELLRVTVKGEVSCTSTCGKGLSAALVGTRLGDLAAEKEVARVEVKQEGGPFQLTGSFLIGYEGKPPVDPSERLVTLEVQGDKCPLVRKPLRLRSFVRDKYGYLLDVGKLRIECVPKAS